MCGLPEKYRVYEPFRFEEEQEATKDWGLMPPLFHEFPSTRDFADTLEWFGLVLQRRPFNCDPSLDPDAAAAADNSDDEVEALAVELEEEDNGMSSVFSREQELAKLPCSSRWMAERLNTTRPFGPVKTKTEIKFFRDNWLRFQSSAVGRDQNGHAFINWSEFKTMWNNEILSQDRGRSKHTDMTLKTSGALASYYKKFSRESREALTLEPVCTKQIMLRESLRSPTRSMSVAHPDAEPATLSQASLLSQHAQLQRIASAVPPRQAPALIVDLGSVAEPPERDSGLQPVQHSDRVLVPPFAGSSTAGAATAPEAAVRSTKRPRMKEQHFRQGQRCRKCGHIWLVGEWAGLHPTPPGVARRYGYTKAVDLCIILSNSAPWDSRALR